MNEQQLLERLVKIDNQITAMNNQKSAHMQELGDLTCPYKMGDVVTVKGWAYEGKKGEVCKIRGHQEWGGKYMWRVYVQVLRKDGSKGALYTDWLQSQEQGK